MARAGTAQLGDPGRWESDVVLSDGGTMHIRPVRREDAPLVTAFHERQSQESIYFRYFTPRPRLSSRELERLTDIDYVDRMALVGLISDDLVGVAGYDRRPVRRDAEVAFFIDDEHHHRGMATVLLEHLAAAARAAGISAFTAQVLPQNRKMLSVFRQAGFEVSSRFSDGVIEVELAIEPTPEALAAIEERARVAERRSVERVLVPRSIAVVGASRRPETIGHAVFRNLLAHGFRGPVYPVNPGTSHVAGVPAHPSVIEVPDDVDLAVVVVPADQVEAVVRECARKRVEGLIVLSAGFAEADAGGRERQQRVVELAHRHGMRLIGPNGMGAINTDPDVRMHATFVDVDPEPGPVGFSSESGTIGAAVLARARRLELGISSFVAVGNRADVSGNDLLQYWEHDDRTAVVWLYLESFGNPRNFLRIARRVARTKPIVAVKRGPALSDLGDVAAPADEAPGWPVDATVSALLAQAGVIRTDTIEELFDVTRILVHQPLPPGRRVALLSNSAGPAVMAADACTGAGLQVSNPVTLAGDASPDSYAAALATLLDDDEVDSVVVLYAPTLTSAAEAVGAAVSGVSAGSPKPVVGAFLDDDVGPTAAAPGGSTVPVFGFPEVAVRALGRAAGYRAWRAEPAGQAPALDDADQGGARELARARLAATGEGPEPGRAGLALGVAEAAELLGTHGLAPVPQRLVASGAEAVAAARVLGYPVVVKATGLDHLAKTEAGGIALDVHGDDELLQAYRRLVDLHGPAMQPALIQAMGPAGVDCLAEVHQHPDLGSVITFGRGGVAADGPDEVATRIVPLTDVDARRLVDGSRAAAALLAAGPATVAAAEALLLRLSALADAVPELAHVRLNPILVGPEGAVVTDVEVRLAPWTADPRTAVRRLG